MILYTSSTYGKASGTEASIVCIQRSVSNRSFVSESVRACHVRVYTLQLVTRIWQPVDTGRLAIFDQESTVLKTTK